MDDDAVRTCLYCIVGDVGLVNWDAVDLEALPIGLDTSIVR